MSERENLCLVGVIAVFNATGICVITEATGMPQLIYLRLVVTGIVYDPLVRGVSEVAP
jgi:uncharacterized membrane protein